MLEPVPTSKRLVLRTSCIKDKVLYTPELTEPSFRNPRDSIIALARHMGYEVLKKVSAEFAMSADEAFCCGTAAVISNR